MHTFLLIALTSCLAYAAPEENPVAPEAAPTAIQNCTTIQQLEPEDVEILPGNKLLVIAYDVILQTLPDWTVDACFNLSVSLKRAILQQCMRFTYEKHEFTELEDGRVRLYEEVLDPGTYEIQEGQLIICADESFGVYDANGTAILVNDTESASHRDNWIFQLGQAGSIISIFALLTHLVAFCLVPSMRNLPGYNLAALSTAFLFGYLFSLIGQIPQVLGLACKMAGILQQYFFLVAFFCMNALSFDVWRTLKMATSQLVVSSHSAKRKKFIFYSIYSWGVPFIISTITVIVDNSKGVPYRLRAGFGTDTVCWFVRKHALLVFFAGPAFVLFVLNAVFFSISAITIQNNTMKTTRDDKRKASAKINFLLYLRLAMMMGTIWLVALVASLVNDRGLWVFADLLNSLQGLFVFLLFTCSKKVSKHFRQSVRRRSTKTLSSDVPGSKISTDHKVSSSNV